MYGLDISELTHAAQGKANTFKQRFSLRFKLNCRQKEFYVELLLI